MGLARRKCDEAILAGLVEVDGEFVVAPGTLVDPETQRVSYRSQPLPAAPAHHYLMLHKPLGVLVTWHDPQGRRTVKDYVPPAMPRLFAVGRLDADTSGLLLLTNDGPLAHRLSHPRYEVPKTYLLELGRSPSGRELGALREGVDLGEGERSGSAGAAIVKEWGDGALVSLTLREGKNRQVRRMCEALDLPLASLVRVAFGPLALERLGPGRVRELTRDEVRALRAAAEQPGSGAAPGRTRDAVPGRAPAPRGGRARVRSR